MPLTAKGEEIKSAMQKQYGEEKGENVFYASKNKGTITGVDADPHASFRKAVDAVDACLTEFTSLGRAQERVK